MAHKQLKMDRKFEEHLLSSEATSTLTRLLLHGFLPLGPSLPSFKHL